MLFLHFSGDSPPSLIELMHRLGRGGGTGELSRSCGWMSPCLVISGQSDLGRRSLFVSLSPSCLLFWGALGWLLPKEGS